MVYCSLIISKFSMYRHVGPRYKLKTKFVNSIGPHYDTLFGLIGR